MLALLLACSTTTTPDDTGFTDTATYHCDGATSIESVALTCTDGLHVATVTTVGWFDEATLRVLDTTGADQSGRSTEPTSYDPDGAWQISDVAVTGPACDGELTYHLVVSGLAGTDCRAWGHDPDALETGCSSL